MNTRALSAKLAIPIFAVSALVLAESGAEQLKMLDDDGDGRLSATEYTASPGKTRAEFGRIDRDGDGYLAPAELEAHRKAKQASAEPEEEEE